MNLKFTLVNNEADEAYEPYHEDRIKGVKFYGDGWSCLYVEHIGNSKILEANSKQLFGIYQEPKWSLLITFEKGDI